MNATHFHLLLNHFPVVGTLIGSLLLLWGIIRKQNTIKSVAAVILAVMAALAIPVFLTGEPAEESVEDLPGVSEALIGLHEDAATIAIWLMGVTGMASLVALIAAWKKNKAANLLFVITFFLSAVCFAAMARTGYYGGQIRHTEIRNDGTINPAGQGDPANGQEGKAKEKDDD
ncbi:MAG: hypothetical protein IPQ06_14300 [Chitinophagaceae bacterium]|nr:hypothetical protein [Chitinophagaceae bacterium]